MSCRLGDDSLGTLPGSFGGGDLTGMPSWGPIPGPAVPASGPAVCPPRCAINSGGAAFIPGGFLLGDGSGTTAGLVSGACFAVGTGGGPILGGGRATGTSGGGALYGGVILFGMARGVLAETVTPYPVFGRPIADM